MKSTEELLEPQPTLEDVVLEGAPPTENSATTPQEMQIDPAEIAALVPLMLPEEKDIPAMVAPIAAIGLSDNEKSEFIQRFSSNTMLVAGLKTIQFRKALETAIVQFLKTPSTAEGAPALSPTQSLIAGLGAIALAVIVERAGGLQSVLSLIGFGSNGQTTTQDPTVGDSNDLFKPSGIGADGQAIYGD